MAGLTPPMAEMIAQLVVRHVSATGACVIDLPAAAPALDLCTSIEIRVHAQDVVERHPDSICITPSRPVTVGQDPPRAKHPPLGNSPQHSPWSTTGWPRGPGPGGNGPSGGSPGRPGGGKPGGPWGGHGGESPGGPGGSPGSPGGPWGHRGHGGPGGPWDHGGHGGDGGGSGGGHEWMPPKHGGPGGHGGHGGHGDGGGGGDGGHEWMPPEHSGPPEHLPPPGPVPMKEEPPARPDPPAQPNPPGRPDGPRPAPGHSPLQPAAVPPDKGGDGGGGPPNPLLPSTSPAPLPPPPPPPPTQPTEPDPPGFIKVSTSLPPPPPASTLQSTSSSTPNSTPTPTPTQTPTQTPSPPPERSQEPPTPDPPQASASPPPPPPPPPSRPASPPPSPPAPAPGFCASAYATIDVSELSGVNPHSYGQYLSLLRHNNIGPGMPGGAHPDIPGHPHRPHQDGGITLAQGKKALVHQYRVRCGVEIPNGPEPVFPGFGGGKEHTRTVTDGHRGCLETCEREAIAMAAQGLLTECLGAAYRSIIGVIGGSGNGDEKVGGNGECRFWYGDGMEHEFLPVHSLRDAHLDVDRWQILYM